MNLYIIFLIILLVVISVYNIIVINKIGIPESISATSYFFKEFNGKYWLFTLFCFICGGILLPIWINASAETLQFLVFLSCSGILFAGATPLFKEDLQKQVHYGGGIIAVVACFVWMFFSGYGHLLLIETVLILILTLINKKNYVYYTELVGLLGIIWLLLEFYK